MVVSFMKFRLVLSDWFEGFYQGQLAFAGEESVGALSYWSGYTIYSF